MWVHLHTSVRNTTDLWPLCQHWLQETLRHVHEEGHAGIAYSASERALRSWFNAVAVYKRLSTLPKSQLQDGFHSPFYPATCWDLEDRLDQWTVAVGSLTQHQQATGPHEDLLTIVKKRKLQWYGHVSRSSGLAKIILQGTVKGGRRPGRQRKRWEDKIKEWTGLEFAKSRRAVENREKWRKLVPKSSVVPQQPSWLRDKWWWW